MRYTAVIAAAVLLSTLPGQAQVGGGGAGGGGAGGGAGGAGGGAGAGTGGGTAVGAGVPGVGATVPGAIPGVGAPTAVGGGPTQSNNSADTGAPTGFPVTATPSMGPSAGVTVPGGGTGAVGGGTLGPITTGIRPGATFGVVSGGGSLDGTAGGSQTNVPGVSGAVSPQGFQGSPSGTFQQPGLAEAIAGQSNPTNGTTMPTTTGTSAMGNSTYYTGGYLTAQPTGYSNGSNGGGGGGVQNAPAVLGSPYTPATSTPSVYGTQTAPGLWPPTAPGTSGRFQLPATVVTADGANGTFTITPYAISPLGTLRNPNPNAW